MKKIVIEIIPHSSQRYNTVGDYWIDADGVGQVRVSDFNPTMFRDRPVPTHEWAVMIHELVELMLTEFHGIPESAITAFDRNWKPSSYYGMGPISEPGDDPGSPYYDEHQLATIIERVLAHELNLHWSTYEDKCERLLKTWPESV